MIIQTESVRCAAASNNTLLLELIGRVGIERLYSYRRNNYDSAVFSSILIIFFWSRFRCHKKQNNIFTRYDRITIIFVRLLFVMRPLSIFNILIYVSNEAQTTSLYGTVSNSSPFFGSSSL